MAPEYHLLNRLVAPDSGYSEAWARVLARLGDYTAEIARAHNLRPQQVCLYQQTRTTLLVRLTMPEAHLILRIAPDASLHALLWFARMVQQQGLPIIHIYEADLRRTRVPFDYLLEQYVGNQAATQLEPPHMRQVARQAGRLLRRIHRTPAPGWGTPTRNGRWLTETWQEVLHGLHAQYALPASALALFTEEQQAQIADVLHDPCLHTGIAPHLLHGAFCPQNVRCTAGETTQLERFLHAGEIVGGDPLLDLALALDPAYPPAWQSGLLEGYTATAMLPAAAQARLARLRLLVAYWSTLRRYAHAEPHAAAYADALQRLAQLTAPSDLSDLSDLVPQRV